MRYQAYPSEDHPCFSHLLICSSAPLEAERPYRRDLDSEDIDYSTERVKALRRDLNNFFSKPGAGSRERRMRVVVRVHGYNVPLKSVKKEYESDQKRFQEDAKSMIVNSPEDYVLFIHYAWPSERIGAGGPLHWIPAMPIGLLVLFLLGAILINVTSAVSNVIGELLLGIGITLTLLRAVTYFRDRDRAGSFGVYDAVEMVRALHHIVQEISCETDYIPRLQRDDAERISLSFVGHSMGTFLTTALIRVLSNVFDAEADSHLWKGNPLAGPFAAAGDPIPVSPEQQEKQRLQRSRIGELFVLDRLILVAADIPVWTITPGRSNELASCLRRFRHTFLFVNDADMVLRMASTLANYFVFPSGTRMGGYRLGNLSLSGRGKANGYGWRAADMREVKLHGGLRSKLLCGEPFRCPPRIGYPLNVIDCTDYTDDGRHLSAFTATHALLRPFNYAATLVLMLLAPLGIGQIDSHGGYFRGRFCSHLIDELALRGLNGNQAPSPQIQAGLKKHRISWITVS